mgnify:CR=1 FL=1
MSLKFFRIFFGFLVTIATAQLIRKNSWDPPCIFGTAPLRDFRLSALKSANSELKKVCWGGGRQTPPFFFTFFFLKIFVIIVEILLFAKFLFYFRPRHSL